MLTRRTLTQLAVVWVVCLVILSLQPRRPEGTRGRGTPLHKIEHVLVFAATGVLLVSLGRGRSGEVRAAAGVIGLAVAIEAAQLAIYRMPVGFEWWDVREDAIGVVAGLLVVRFTGIRGMLLSETRD